MTGRTTDLAQALPPTLAEVWPRWLLELPHDARMLVVGAPVVSLVAVIAAAFVIGGFWALRGRAALRFPACRRCGSLLHGSADKLPERCTECGSALTARRSVLWLRFRRQPLTILITAPVVMLGGLTLSLGLMGFTMTSLERSINRARERMTAQDTEESPPRPAAQTLAISDDEPPPFTSASDLVNQCWQGGEKGMEALLTLSAMMNGRAKPFLSDVAERETALLQFLRDLEGGRRPLTPFVAPPVDSPWRDRLRRAGLGGPDGWRSVAGPVLHVLAVGLPSDELPREATGSVRDEIERLAEALLPSVDIAMPRQVLTESPYVVRAMAAERRSLAFVVIKQVMLNDKVVWPPEGQEGLLADIGTLVAPESPGTYAVRVTYESFIHERHAPDSPTPSGGALAARSAVWAGEMIVSGDSDRLEPQGLGGRSASELITPYAWHLRSGAFESYSVQSTFASLALEGRWELLSDGGWETIGTVRASDGNGALVALTRRARVEETPDRLRLRFVPADDLSQASLTARGAASHRGALPNFFHSSGTGVLNETAEFECVIDRRFETAGGVRGAIYALETSRFTGPTP